MMSVDDITKVACDYFSNLFESKGMGDSRHFLGILHFVNTDMNRYLLFKFTKEDIFLAVREMAPTKATRDDGMPTLFFQRFWHIVGNYASNFWLGILNDGNSLDEISGTNIILIPKQREPRDMTHFRLINLCTVLFKIISKVVVNRL